MLKIIVAHDKNQLIGNGSQIPWHISEDFKHFKQTTMNHKMIMGSVTFESIGKPLPGRETIVLNFDKNYNALGCKVVDNYMELVNLYKDSDEIVYVVGGASIYRLFLPFCEELIISEVKGEYVGNIYFPEYKHLFTQYKEDERKEFTIKYYKRK